MLARNKHTVRAQMVSLDVSLVRVLRIGERPRRVR